MKQAPIVALALAAAALLGGGANLLLLPAPSTAAAKPLADAPWELSPAKAWDRDAIDAAWADKAPWGAAPKPQEPAAPPPPPPPELVGVIKDGKTYRAVFSVPGAGQLALLPGSALPGGGRVLSVAGLRVVWVDADGARHQREIFNTYQEELAPR